MIDILNTRGTEFPRLPFPRTGALSLSPTYDELRGLGPVNGVRTPAGDLAWLVTGYEEARALFSDTRRRGRSSPAQEEAVKLPDAAIMGAFVTGNVALIAD